MIIQIYLFFYKKKWLSYKIEKKIELNIDAKLSLFLIS